MKWKIFLYKHSKMKGHLKLGIFIVRKKTVTISEIMYITPTPACSEKKKISKEKEVITHVNTGVPRNQGKVSH